MRSLKLSLILGAVAGATAVLLLAGALLFLVIRRGVLAHFDRSLIERTGQLAGAIEHDGRMLDIDFEDLDMREFNDADATGFLLLRDLNGPELYRSPSLGRADLPRQPTPGARLVCRWVTLPTGRPGRITALFFRPRFDEGDDDDDDDDGGGGQGNGGADDDRITPADLPTLVLVLARDIRSVARTLNPIAWSMGLAGVLTVAVASLVLWLVIHRALRPVGAVSEQISRLDPTDLSKRIHAGRMPAELLPIVDRFNVLLDRVQAAFERERQFTSDAAHELRTPLAGLRTAIEVELAQPRSADDYAAVLRDCLDIICQVQGMVENLLWLARIEGGQVRPERRPVALLDCVQAAWKPLRDQADRRGLAVRMDVSPELRVQADESLLLPALQNVLGNAVAHATEGGDVTVAAHRCGQTACLVASNPTTLDPEQVELVFDPYWRASASRSRTGLHCGLGLPLVRRIIEAFGGRAAARVTDDRRFEVTLSLPAATAE